MSALSHAIRQIIRAVDRFTETTGRIISWLNIALMLSICAVVFMRYVLNTGSIALQELAIYFHATIFLGACAYTLRHDGHVRVDIFYRNFSPRIKGLIDASGTILFLIPVCLFIGLMSWDYVEQSWALRETSHEPGGLPTVYLLKTLILILAATLFFQGIAEFLRGFLAFTNHQVPTHPEKSLKEPA